jgi:hypothetical protein
MYSSTFFSMLRRGWLCIVALVLTALSAAQPVSPVIAPDIKIPPSKIEFPNWRLVGEYEWATEYNVGLPTAAPSGVRENDTIPVRIFIPVERRGPIPIVVISHYWGAVDLRAEVSLAQELASRNIASAVVTLPYHLQRTPAGVRSGALAIQPDPVALRATTYQAVQDLRRTIDFLSTRSEFDSSKIGIAGTSLGAIVSALTYAVEPRVKNVAFILGGIELANILWSSSRVVVQRDELRAKGFTEEKLQTELASVEPANFLPRDEPGNSFVVVGKFDTVIPKSSSDALIAKMPGIQILSIDTGHYGGIFVQRRLLRETAAFFDAKFTGRTYAPPTRIYAPTIRIGLGVDVPSGFEIGAGLDIWAFDKPRRNLATLFISPRGPRIWLHRQIGSGFSIGLNASEKRVGIGLLWSTVL